MNILFVHQNMPGQFKHLAPYLAGHADNRVAFLTQRDNVELPGVQRITYASSQSGVREPHPYLAMTDNAVRTGQEVVLRCNALRRDGFRPDIIVAHPGWGETLYLKDLYPSVPLLHYCEFFYRGRGADIGFDPMERPDLDVLLRARTRSSHLLLALDACDRGVSPTHWQRATHPAVYHGKIAVIFDGIDTQRVAPDADACFRLPTGRTLKSADRVVTYVARNLEPYRGFPTFMRAVPRILSADPEAQVVIVGGDEVSYGTPPRQGGTWRAAMLAEIGGVDANRVHMLPRLPYGAFLDLLRISSAHAYLTYPFVLSWSFMEAMACGCAVVASRSPPVEEVATDGHNATLVDFFDPAALADAVLRTLRGGPAIARQRERARRTIVQNYGLDRCLPRYLALLNSML